MNNAVTQKDLSSYDSLAVGIVSDTHGFLDPSIHQQLSKCDVILHAGDIGSLEVLKQLKQHTKHVFSVRGNNDVPEKWSNGDHKGLGNIPRHVELKAPGGTIALLHGDQFDPVEKRHHKLREHFSAANAIIYGHSHILVCDQEEQPWVLNPGAAGKTRTKGGASCLILHTNEKQWEVATFRVSKAA